MSLAATRSCRSRRTGSKAGRLRGGAGAEGSGEDAVCLPEAREEGACEGGRGRVVRERVRELARVKSGREGRREEERERSMLGRMRRETGARDGWTAEGPRERVGGERESGESERESEDVRKGLRERERKRIERRERERMCGTAEREREERGERVCAEGPRERVGKG